MSTEVIAPALLVEPTPAPTRPTAVPESFSADPFAFSTPDVGPDLGTPPSGGGGDPFAGDPFASHTAVPTATGAAFPMDNEENEADRMGSPADGFALPVLDAPPESAREPEAKKSKKPQTLDFQFLLGGYACYVERGRVAFGRPYGTRIIDLHAYDTAGDLDRAYVSFLESKIAEGFIPRTDLTGDLPRGVTVMPLDQERLAAAWRNLT